MYIATQSNLKDTERCTSIIGMRWASEAFLCLLVAVIAILVSAKSSSADDQVSIPTSGSALKLNTYCDLGTLVAGETVQVKKLVDLAIADSQRFHSENLAYALALQNERGHMWLLLRPKSIELKGEYVFYKTNEQKTALILRIKPILKSPPETEYSIQLEPRENMLELMSDSVADSRINWCLVATAETVVFARTGKPHLLYKVIQDGGKDKFYYCFYRPIAPSADVGKYAVYSADQGLSVLRSFFRFDETQNSALVSKFLKEELLPVYNSFPPGDPALKGEVVEESANTIHLAEAAASYCQLHYSEPVSLSLRRRVNGKLYLIFQSRLKSDTDYFFQCNDASKLEAIFDPAGGLKLAR